MKNFISYFGKATGFVLILFLQFLFNRNVHAQWAKTSGPPGINVNVFFDNGSLLYAGTSSKGVFRSSDNGATWTVANVGLQNATILSFFKDQTYLYAGTDKGVYRSSNGSTWAAANNGIETQVVKSMVIGGGFLFAGTTNGVYRSANKGNTWADASGGALHFTSIPAMCYVKNTLIVEGDNYLFTSTDAGDTWFVDQGSTSFYVIKHFLVLGDTLLASARNGVFHSYNGGVSWSNFLPVETDDYTDLLGFSFSNGVVYTGDKKGMFKSTNYGRTWTAVPASGLRFGTRFYNYFVQSGNIFLLGMDELGVFRSADSGRTWNQSIPGFPAVSNIDNCLLNINDSILTGTHSDGIYRTINNGNVWRKIGTKNNNDTLSNAVVYSLLNPAPNIILAGTCGDGLYRSADNGKTWKHITVGLPFKLFDNYECDFGLTKSGANILLATTNGIYYSTNNGQSWKASNLTGDRIAISAIAANGNVAVAGVSEGVSPFQSGIYRSTNKGVTWTFTQEVHDIISLAGDGATNFYGGSFFDNWRSTNNGISWNQIGTGMPFNTGGYSIKVIGGNNVFIGNNTGIYFSNNKGNSFTNVNTGLDPGPNNSVQGIEANSTYLFAGLFKNGVWRRRLSDFGISAQSGALITKLDAQNKSEISLPNKLTVHPNPSIEQATIQYQTDATGEVGLRITDQFGKVVEQSKQILNAGSYTKTIDVKHLSPGIYFVQLINNRKATITKLVVAR